MEWYKILQSWKIIQNSLAKTKQTWLFWNIAGPLRVKHIPQGVIFLHARAAVPPLNARPVLFASSMAEQLTQLRSKKTLVCTDIKPRWVSLRCEWEDHMLHRPHKDRWKPLKRRWICRLPRRKTACAVFPLESDANTPGAPKKKNPEINIDAEGNPQWHKKAKYQQSRSPPLWERMEKQLSSLTSIESQQPSTSSDQNFSLASVVASSLVPLHGRQALNKTLESLPGIQRIITTCDQQVFAKAEIILESRSGTLFVMHTSRKEPSVPFAIKKMGSLYMGSTMIKWFAPVGSNQTSCKSGARLIKVGNQSKPSENYEAFELLHESSWWQIQHLSLLASCSKLASTRCSAL